MIVFDSSVLVAALVESELHHRECYELVTSSPFGMWSHGLVETFNTLTRGKIKPRPTAAMVAQVLRVSIRPRAIVLQLTEDALQSAFDTAESVGVRGGAIFDYLHLVTARHHQAERFYTLNTSHFQHFWREGDPVLVHPTDHGSEKP